MNEAVANEVGHRTPRGEPGGDGPWHCFVACPDCGYLIRTRIPSCPECGLDLPAFAAKQEALGRLRPVSIGERRSWPPGLHLAVLVFIAGGMYLSWSNPVGLLLPFRLLVLAAVAGAPYALLYVVLRAARPLVECVGPSHRFVRCRSVVALALELPRRIDVGRWLLLLLAGPFALLVLWLSARSLFGRALFGSELGRYVGACYVIFATMLPVPWLSLTFLIAAEKGSDCRLRV